MATLEGNAQSTKRNSEEHPVFNVYANCVKGYFATGILDLLDNRCQRFKVIMIFFLCSGTRCRLETEQILNFYANISFGADSQQVK